MTGSIAAVVFLTLIACLVLTVPIGFSLGIASLGYILYTKQLTFGFIAQNMVTGCDSFPTMAIPFFIFAGELMGGGGISKRLLNLANVFFGRIQGGLAIVTVVVCMFFAAISGSGPATVAAVGGMVIPTMLEKGYDKKFVLALIAAAGSIGVIIPPSIPMVIYAVTTNSSVSTLFLAGFVPGILIGLVLIAYSYFYAKKMGYKGDDEPFSVKRALRETKEGFWAILSPVIILGGIYGGIFTPTEAAAVSVIYSIIVGCVIYRELDLKKLIQCTKNACETTASILIVIGCRFLQGSDTGSYPYNGCICNDVPDRQQDCDSAAYQRTAADCWLLHGNTVCHHDSGTHPVSRCNSNGCRRNTLRYHHGSKPCHRLHYTSTGRKPFRCLPCWRNHVGYGY